MASLKLNNKTWGNDTFINVKTQKYCFLESPVYVALLQIQRGYVKSEMGTSTVHSTFEDRTS